MTEESKTIGNGTELQQTEQKGNEPLIPSVEELMAQVAAERAEKEKYKTRADKASSEAAEYKRQLRSKQTEEEAEAEAQAEAKRLADEEREAMRKELNHIKAVNSYKNISNEKTVENLIEAISESDHMAIAKIIDAEIKAAVNVAQAEWMKSRPRVNAGGIYSSMTKDEIMAIPDRTERRKAIALNQELFMQE